MVSFLKVFFTVLLIWMSYQLIKTSIESNLFKEWGSLGSIPWMRATVWDFYANASLIFIWICYKERNIALDILWFVLLVTLGSIATCVYVLIQLFRLKPDEGLMEFFSKKNGQ